MTKRRSAILLGLAMSMSLIALPTAIGQQDRAHDVGRKVKCMCGGCNDSAATCFHVGGAFSGPCDVAKAALKKIDQLIASGESDDLIVQSFVQEYGPTALVEPPHSGIGRVAWSMPAAYLLIGSALVVLVINRWRKRPAFAAGTGAPAGPAISPELLERARRRVAEETED